MRQAGIHVLNLRRLPLLLPVIVLSVGLALVRTDVVAVIPAAILLMLFLLLLLSVRRYAMLLVLLFGAALGFADLISDAGKVAVDAGWLGHDVVIDAEVERLEKRPVHRRYLLKQIIRQDGETLSGQAWLYQYGLSKNRVIAREGQQIHARVRWRLPRNYQNPGSFDYRAWSFDRHIALIGSVKGDLLIGENDLPWLERMRSLVRQAIHGVSEQGGGVLQALLLGDRSQISEQANRVFSATGTAHLLAISGMHVGMVAAWVFAIAWFVLTRRERWIVNLPVRNIALICGCVAAAAYATLAGWPLPAIRAVFMLAAAALAWCLASRAEPLNTLMAALGLILIFDPSAIASLSLWLSFLATAAILFWAGKRASPDASTGSRLIAAGKALVWISLLATLATLPLIVATFGRIPVYSPAANLVMVPLYALLVMPAALLAELLALTGFTTAAGGLMQFAGWAAEGGLYLLSAISEWPAGELWAIAPPLWAGLLYACGMLFGGWMLLKNRRLLSLVSALLTLALYVGVVLHETDVQQVQWIVWDVGQGAASTLLLPGNRVIVVDVPGRKGSRFNGGTTVAAGLRQLGFTHVDVLILSHAQSDHLGGAISLMQHLNSIGQIWLPDVPSAHRHESVKAMLAYAAKRGIAVRWLAAGDNVNMLDETVDESVDEAVGRSRFRVLWPPRAFDPANANNSSLVVMAEAAGLVRLLWPGDIESEAEETMFKRVSEQGDVMLMPHHGSNSSSRPEFIRMLQPSLAVAQTGFANYYGFPKAEVVARYKAVGAQVLNTADGAIIVSWPADKGKVELQQWQENRSPRREMAIKGWKSWRLKAR